MNTPSFSQFSSEPVASNVSDTLKATRNKMLSLIVGIPLALGLSSCSNTPEASQNPDATQKIATSLQTIGLIPGDIDVSQWNDSILESKTPEEISKKEMIALSLAVFGQACVGEKRDKNTVYTKLFNMAQQNQHYLTCLE